MNVKPKTLTKRVEILLSPETLEALTAEATARGMSVGALCRFALERVIKPAPRRGDARQTSWLDRIARSS